MTEIVIETIENKSADKVPSSPKKPRGRPRKYFSEEERKAAKQKYEIDNKQERNTKKKTIYEENKNYISNKNNERQKKQREELDKYRKIASLNSTKFGED